MAAAQEANKDVARRLAGEVFSRGDLETFEELLADDYLNHNIPVPGIAGDKAGFREEFFGVPPSNGVVEWTEIHWLRVADSRIVEHWTNFDQLGILRQLGALGDG
jgi:predicted SnoaL-like aldol condensation-catalyzing enzyme